MDIVLIVTVGVMNICCFFIGARVGQKVVNREPLALPEIHNPVTAIQEKIERKKELDRLETILQNIEAYDGTGFGQQDLPGGRA